MTHAVLIPSKGRPQALKKLFEACPSLNAESTFVGVAHDEHLTYAKHLGPLWDKVQLIDVYNPHGITSVARECLRGAAVAVKYDRYVLADDNCRFTDESLHKLLLAQQIAGGVMAGAHPTAAHFHADNIARGVVKKGLTIYPQVGMIFWCIPDFLYAPFRYPHDCYYDDVYFILHCLSRGHDNFSCCLEAEFKKTRHAPGGTGDAATRVRKMGLGLMRLAEDFPQWMTPQHVGTRVPYTRMLAAVHAGKLGLT